MALNLLSDEKDVADTAAAKKSAALSSVAFRAPPLDHPSSVIAEKKEPRAQERKLKKEESSYTTPEALSGGFGVNILGAAAEQGDTTASFALFIMTILGASLGTALVLGVWFMLTTEEEERVAAAVAAEQMTLAATKRTMQETQVERKSAEERLATIETARALLSRHIYWTHFFRFLESETLPDVYYTNLAVDPAGNIRLAAVGRNFSAVARQLLAFEGAEDVETIRTTKAAAEISGSTPGVQFDLALTVKPGLLFFSETR